MRHETKIQNYQLLPVKHGCYMKKIRTSEISSWIKAKNYQTINISFISQLTNVTLELKIRKLDGD